MKKFLQFTVVLACLQLLMVSCGEDPKLPNGYIATTEDGTSTFVFEGYQSTTQGFTLFKPEGCQSTFYIKEAKFTGDAYDFVKTADAGLSDMQEPTEGWQPTAEIMAGATYWARYTSMTEYKYIKFRVAYVEGNNVGIEYAVTRTEERPNGNANTSAAAWASDWSMPHLNSDNYFVAHTLSVKNEDVMNYAFEWNDSKKHAEWVAFYFDEQTAQDVTSRTNAWSTDPSLPAEMQTSNDNHTNDGFDRGHICASEDRVWSVEANEQTFYFSNMSPQLASFNQGFWVNVENQVRKWGRDIPSTYTKVYVTKGGTLNNLLVNFTSTVKGADGKIPTTDENGFTIKGLACPKYYYVAVLAEKADGTYQALAILAEHKEGQPRNPTADEMKSFVISVDSLEKFSGIDFFCNLPDGIENAVESNLNLEDWAW